MTDQAIALLAPRIGTRAACAASGVAQASWYRRHRASPAPPRRPPVPHRDRAPAARPGPGRAGRDPRRAALGAVRRHRPRRGLGHPAGRGHLPRLAVHLLPAAPRRGRDPRAARAGHPPRRGQARAHGHRAEPGLVLGHHQAARPGEMDLLLPLRHPRHLLPLRRRLDGRHPRVRRPGRETDRRDRAPSRASAAGSSPSTPTAAPR